MNTIIKRLVRPTAVALASTFGPHTRGGREPRLWLLMYHRVLPLGDQRFYIEEPGMVVRPETLEMHVREVKKNFELMPLSQWVNAYKNGESLPARACAITFDDGWMDNYEHAFPILKAESAPATLFAVAEKIGTDFQFWPNIVAAILHRGSAAKAAAHPAFRKVLREAANKYSPDEIADVIRRLKGMTDADIYSALETIGWRSLCSEVMPPALMGWDQLKQMASSGLVEIGSHTCNHKRLKDLPLAEIQYEVGESKKILERELGRSVDLFCFPNGDYDDIALDLVERNYQASVTTKRGINRGKALHLHQLTRIGIHDEVANNRMAFRARLSGWV